MGFPATVVRTLQGAKILGIRAGRGDHRFIGVWVVSVRGRVFVRSWELRPGGWHATLYSERAGTIQVGSRELAVRPRRVSNEALQREIDAAYAAKYPTPGARRYVDGFRRGRRRAGTTELVPA